MRGVAKSGQGVYSRRMSEESNSPKIRVISGPQSGMEIEITGNGVFVGRDVTCDITLTGEGISRQHAKFTAEGDQVYVEDAGSTNGMYLNTSLLAGREPAYDGDKTKIGDCYLVIIGGRKFEATVSRKRQYMLAGILLLLSVTVVGWAWIGGRKAAPDPTFPLSIKSYPDGATIFNGGEEKGKTPWQTDSVKAGKYRILLRREGYRDKEVVVDVPQGNSIAVHELVKVSDEDADVVKITTMPAGGQVYVDGMFRGRTPTFKDKDTESGPLLVSGLSAAKEHWAYFVVKGEKSDLVSFRPGDGPLRMLMWAPDVLITTRSDRKYLGMVRRREANGDLLVAIGENQEIRFKKTDIKLIRKIEPVRIKGTEGIRIDKPKSKAPVLTIDAFPEK